MAIYVLLSNLTDEGRKVLKERPERLTEVNQEIEKMGARVLAQYAVLGRRDFINIVEAPSNEMIARISLELGSRSTVRLTTLPALTIDAFAQLVRESGPKSFVWLVGGTTFWAGDGRRQAASQCLSLSGALPNNLILPRKSLRCPKKTGSLLVPSSHE